MKKELGTVSFEMAEDMSVATITIAGGSVQISPQYAMMTLKALLQDISFKNNVSSVVSFHLGQFKVVNTEVITEDGGILLCKLALDDTRKRQLIVCMTSILRRVDQFKLYSESVGFSSYGECHPILINGVLAVEELFN